MNQKPRRTGIHESIPIIKWQKGCCRSLWGKDITAVSSILYLSLQSSGTLVLLLHCILHFCKKRRLVFKEAQYYLGGKLTGELAEGDQTFLYTWWKGRNCDIGCSLLTRGKFTRKYPNNMKLWSYLVLLHTLKQRNMELCPSNSAERSPKMVINRTTGPECKMSIHLVGTPKGAFLTHPFGRKSAE